MDPRQSHRYPLNQTNYQYLYPTQKMYINPHFNQISKPVQTVYYVNPHFHQQNKVNNELVNPKIHFNPKFMNPSNKIAPPQHTNPTSIYVYNERNHITVPVTETAKPPEPITQETSKPISQSRYSIVRNKVITPSTNAPKVVSVNATVHKSTITINKYKSVHINSVKKVLGQTPATSSKTPAIENINRKIPSSNSKNKYKLVKSIATTSPSIHNNTKNKYIKHPDKIRLSLSKCKYVKPGPEQTIYKYNKRLSKTRNTSSTKLKVKRTSTNKEKMTVNNIPCPLFKKYGFCIRKTKGNCKFLHDKKHVSICRKFLKGLCHDSYCLLSHELSSKKMPTCDFYLRGMCTKSDCPYLHVKLNDNATVCMNFLKGYCENGKKCMKRHVNKCPYETEKSKCPKKSCPYSHTNNKNRKLNKINKRKTTVPFVSKECRQKEVENTNKVNEVKNKPYLDSDAASRYYVNDMSDKEQVDIDIDVIKPSRCKLGSLPSFIKL